MVNVLNAERMLIQAKLVWQVMNVESALTMMIVKDKKSVWMMANVVRTDKLNNCVLSFSMISFLAKGFLIV